MAAARTITGESDPREQDPFGGTTRRCARLLRFIRD